MRPGLDTRLDWEAINAVADGRDIPHQATETPRVTEAATSPAPDPLADLLQTPIRHLKAPLPVASSILGCTIYLVANDHQAASVRATGGVPYTAEEIDILWALHETTKPEAWSDNLRLVHDAKRRFAGSIIPECEEI